MMCSFMGRKIIGRGLLARTARRGTATAHGAVRDCCGP